MTGIKTRVAETVRFAKNKLEQDAILSKSVRGNFVSNVQYTKPKGQQAQASGGGGGTVFPAHNKSPIDKIVPDISKGKDQQHPGKTTANTNVKFCKWCGIDVGGKSVQLLQIAPKSPFLTDMGQHETRTKKHTLNVSRGIEYVKCAECHTIHPKDKCPGNK